MVLKNVNRLYGLAVLLLIVIVSCTGAGKSPSVPEIHEPAIQASAHAGSGTTHHLLGYYTITFEKSPDNTWTSETTLERDVSTHWNALKWLEQTPCTTCLQVTGIAPSGNGTLLADVKVTHPFPNQNFTGFDLRGIAIFAGSHSFPESGLTLPDRFAGDGAIVNPDGYTTLYNPSTTGSGPGGLQGYMKGKYSSPSPPDATLNGFIRFSSDGAENTRNAFYAGGFVERQYEIDMHDGMYVLGYAVDVCWAAPLVPEVTDPMTDFGIEANCPEPWKIDVEQTGQWLHSLGGRTELTISVYDRTGYSSHSSPVIECPELFNGTLIAGQDSEAPDHTKYTVEIDNALIAPVGNYPVLISVEDNDNATSPAWLDLTAYQVFDMEVKPAWDVAYGGDGAATYNDIHCDDFGNVYIIGGYSGTIDFDPGPDVLEHTFSNGEQPYISKFDDQGNLLWNRVWGSEEGGEGAYGIDTDTSGNVFVCGFFDETVDFNTDGGGDPHTAAGSTDIYVMKFDSSGNYQWTKSFGGTESDWTAFVGITSTGNIIISGHFVGTCDFDPGSGDHNITSAGFQDMYVNVLDSSGNFINAFSWGGVNYEFFYDAKLDVSDNLYVDTKLSGGPTDMDPGPGEDIIDAKYVVSKFNPAGSYEWGAPTDDNMSYIEPDSLGNLFYIGNDGDGGAFIRKLDSDGLQSWAEFYSYTPTPPYEYINIQTNFLAVDLQNNLHVTMRLQQNKPAPDPLYYYRFYVSSWDSMDSPYPISLEAIQETDGANDPEFGYIDTSPTGDRFIVGYHYEDTVYSTHLMMFPPVK